MTLHAPIASHLASDGNAGDGHKSRLKELHNGLTGRNNEILGIWAE